MKKIDLKQIDSISKIVLIILVVAVSYFIFLLILRPLFIAHPVSMADMMNRMFRGDTTSNLINIASLILSLIIAVVVSLYLFRTQTEDKEYKIIRKALSEDEKEILDEIKRAGEITQDSLRFRLNWSKAKISTILTNLDKREIIQRERIGKTYKVYLQK